MNNLARKLIHEGSEKRRIRMNLISMGIGAGLLLIGIGCFVAKGISDHITSAAGPVRELFFLLLIGAVFMFCGFITFVVTGIKNTVTLMRKQDHKEKAGGLFVALACAAVTLFCIGCVLFLTEANSGVHTMPIGIACLAASFLMGAASIYLRIRKGEKKNEEKK